MLKTLFTSALPAWFLLFSGSAFATEAPNLKKEIARINHATVWSAFETKKNCKDILLGSNGTSTVQASDYLLTKLVGDQMPKADAIVGDGSLYVNIWGDLGDIRNASTEEQMRMRDDLSARIYRIQHSFQGDTSRVYTISHAVRGEAAIREHLVAFQKNHQFAYDKLDVSDELKRKDRVQNNRMARNIVTLGAMMNATIVGTYMLTDSSIATGAVLIGSSLLAQRLHFVTSYNRVTSFLTGDDRYQHFVKPHLAHQPVPSNYDPEVILDFKNLEEGPYKGFYVEGPLAITNSALEALRKDKPEAFKELFRSCLVQSPGNNCEEHTAFNELLNTNEHGYFEGLTKTMLELYESKQKGLLRPGRFATAFYRESDTGEPVLLQWLQFDLNPESFGRRRKKVAESEKAKETNWGDQLQPVNARSFEKD